MKLETPFEIGAEYWLPTTSPRQTTEPCPVCAGAKEVLVLARGINAGQSFAVDCDACGRGYEGPRGYVTEYHYDPHAELFIIAGVVRLDDDDWTVEDAAKRQARFKTLRATEDEALAVSKASYLAQEERNADRRRHRRNGVNKATWTVRYHTDAIKKLERELAYRRSKIERRPS